MQPLYPAPEDMSSGHLSRDVAARLNKGISARNLRDEHNRGDYWLTVTFGNNKPGHSIRPRA